jgi:trimeric autotransporter adhesin
MTKKIKQLALSTAFAIMTIASNAQVKIGSNPTNVSTDVNLETESTSGSHNVMLKSNGMVGLNTTTPVRRLHVVGAGGLTGSSYGSVGGADNLLLENNGNSNIGLLGSYGNSASAIKFYRSDATNDMAVVQLNRTADNKLEITNNYLTNPTGHLVLVNGGLVGVGTSSPTEVLTVAGNILATGTITPSDARYKENISTLGNSLANLVKLRGVSYTHKEEFVKTKKLKEGNQIGFIAQELEAIYPEFVVTSTDGYKAVDYSRITPVLVEALKEVNQKLEAQQAEINELKASLKAKFNKLK